MRDPKLPERVSAINKLYALPGSEALNLRPEKLINSKVSLETLDSIASITNSPHLNALLSDVKLADATRSLIYDSTFSETLKSPDKAAAISEKMRQLAQDGTLKDFVEQVGAYKKGSHPIAELLDGTFAAGGKKPPATEAPPAVEKPPC